MIAKRPSLTFKKIATWIGAGIVAALLLSNAYHTLFPSFKIYGISMLPNIQPGEKYSAEKWTAIHRHDIMFIDQTKLSSDRVEHQNGVYIKRIVGLPGDTLSFDVKSGMLTSINGKKLDAKKSTNYQPFWMNSKMPESQGEKFLNIGFTVSDGGVQYGVFGPDNSAFAGDERLKKYTDVVFHFPWLEEQVKPGESIATVTIPAGNYFALSDNRTAGTDSRHFGLVPESALLYKLAQ